MNETPDALVERIWNWLPAFCAVAEVEHLPTASAMLGVTPPALSRTVHLLEERLGRPLFRRVGRRIELNVSGSNLLARVREGMRSVRHGVMEARDEVLVGSLRIYSSGVITPLHVEPALAKMHAAHPQLVAYLRSILATGVAEGLSSGRIDLAFQSTAVSSEHIETEYLGEVNNGVYCGQPHPLYRRRSLTLDRILEHPFIAPIPDESGQTREGWPPGMKRRVDLYTDHMAAGIRGCAEGRFLAVLPDALGRKHGFRRLPIEGLPSAPMFVMHRPFLGIEERAELLLKHVRESIASSGA
jgi:DNA-binding transcriptional LysR family regulator